MDHKEGTTINGARKILGYKSRNSIEILVKQGKIKCVAIPHSKQRLFSLKDIEKLKKQRS
jgi:hypothetical protein